MDFSIIFVLANFVFFAALFACGAWLLLLGVRTLRQHELTARERDKWLRRLTKAEVIVADTMTLQQSKH